MENRTLRLSEDAAEAYYDYEFCTGWFPFTKCEWRTEKYDLTDKPTRIKLIHIGFKLRVIK